MGKIKVLQAICWILVALVGVMIVAVIILTSRAATGAPAAEIDRGAPAGTFSLHPRPSTD